MKNKAERYREQYQELRQRTKTLAKELRKTVLDADGLRENLALKRLLLKRLRRECAAQAGGWAMTEWEEELEKGRTCLTVPKEPEPAKIEVKVDELQMEKDFEDEDSEENPEGEESEPDIIPSLLNKKKRTEPAPVVPEIEEAKRFLHVLFKNTKLVWPFEEKVDPVALKIPDYLAIVKTPMDLGTVRTRLHDGLYTHNIESFVNDVRLVFSNATLFNNPHHEIFRLALQCSALFEKKLEKSKLIVPPLPLGFGSNNRWKTKITWRRAPVEEQVCWGAHDVAKRRELARKG